MLMERNGMDRRQPIGTMTDSRGTLWSVYDVRHDAAGEIKQAYVEFSQSADGRGQSMKDWGLSSPHWTKEIYPGSTLKITHRIEFRLYKHEHPEFFGCTTCPYDVVDSEQAGWAAAREWLTGKGWPVGGLELKTAKTYTGGGAVLWRFEVPTEDAHESAKERSIRLVWF
ncbi:hypothetical protein SNOUR_43865 [Streptomyces noursei ATCC 11455]|nr:hypothetical protein SNOUR_00085 [Streptomyces noursei ATCC 11455]ANZ21995.1 hypothetical protein SNOUR_43865 [Streptomyces noursei ATCC 11455]